MPGLPTPGNADLQIGCLGTPISRSAFPAAQSSGISKYSNSFPLAASLSPFK
jgi:hypothetical protein